MTEFADPAGLDEGRQNGFDGGGAHVGQDGAYDAFLIAEAVLRSLIADTSVSNLALTRWLSRNE